MKNTFILFFLFCISTIDLSKFANGIYLVTISDGINTTNKLLIKK